MARNLSVAEVSAIAQAFGASYPNGGRLGEAPPSIEDVPDPEKRRAAQVLADMLREIR